ncbi:MAG: three-Cys-motif partner protein TcmP [Chloroflexi bacterium]|nr:three-Cys-motif partner protein TcmP [Chloroflexota bacterium]
MKNYLEPVEDGLLMRSSGPWVAKKLDYLKRYIEIFETAMRKKWQRRNFVDLFSGPGKCRTDNGRIFLGSPLLALTTTHPFTNYFFADIDSASINALQERCKALPLYDRIRFLAEDSNEAVARVISEIQTLDRLHKSPSLNLAFLDPEGLELEWKTVAALASVQKMDLIIHYPVMGLLYRLLFASKNPLGDKFWKEVIQRDVHGQRRLF